MYPCQQYECERRYLFYLNPDPSSYLLSANQIAVWPLASILRSDILKQYLLGYLVI